MEKSMLANRINCLLRTSVCAALLTGGTLAHAVEARLYQLGDGGAIAPHLSIEIGSDNNVLRQNEGSDASTYVRLEPTLRYLVQQRNNRLTFRYSGDYYLYGEDYCLEPRDADCPNGSPQYDKATYDDHTFSVQGFLEVSRKLRITANLQQAIVHQPLGTGLSANAGYLSSLTEPDSYANTLLRAEMSYGAPLARGELRFGLTHTQRKFNGNADLSEKSFQPSGTVLYRIGNKTQLFAGISQSTVSGGNSERDISRQFAGITVDASAITSGSFQLNNVKENFGGNRSDLEYVGWDLEVSWKPRRYSTITVSGGRETSRGLFNLDDPTVSTVRGQDIGLTTNLGVDWQHFWKDRFSTDVGLQWNKNKGLGENSTGILGSDSDDLTTKLRLEGNYNIRRWLDLGAFVVSDVRDGQNANRDYQRTLVGLTANGTF